MSMYYHNLVDVTDGFSRQSPSSRRMGAFTTFTATRGLSESKRRHFRTSGVLSGSKWYARPNRPTRPHGHKNAGPTARRYASNCVNTCPHQCHSACMATSTTAVRCACMATLCVHSNGCTREDRACDCQSTRHYHHVRGALCLVGCHSYP